MNVVFGLVKIGFKPQPVQMIAQVFQRGAWPTSIERTPSEVQELHKFH